MWQLRRRRSYDKTDDNYNSLIIIQLKESIMNEKNMRVRWGENHSCSYVTEHTITIKAISRNTHKRTALLTTSGRKQRKIAVNGHFQ